MISAASSGGGLPEHCVDFLPNGTSQPPSEEDLTTAFLQCMAQMITDHQDVEGELITRNSDAIRDLMVLFSAALVFFMQAGFAMLCAGAVRKKNLQNTMLKNLLDACGASLAYFAVGYAFSYGDSDNSFIGASNFFLSGLDDTNFTFWVFQFTFCASSATIVAGTLAERCQMIAYFYYSAMVSGFVYPVAVHAFWSSNGFLSPFKTDGGDLFLGTGVLDFAGGAVVHLLGGVIAFIATKILGPRRGRFHDVTTGEPLAEPKAIVGHNMGLQLLGTMILWFGWYGFNGGSALLFGTEHDFELAALAAVNTTLSAGVAGITALFGNMFVLQRLSHDGKVIYDLQLTMNGVLAGLVAITAGCGLVEPWAAVIIGMIGGLLYLGASRLLIWMRVDDAVDAIPVHAANGAWGMIALGLFASPDRLLMAYGHDTHVGFFYSVFNRFYDVDFTLVGAQIVGCLFIIAWSAAIMTPFFLALDWFGLFRSSVKDELQGLDRSLHKAVDLNEVENAVGSDALAAFEKRLAKTIQKEVVRRKTSGSGGSSGHPTSVHMTTSRTSGQSRSSAHSRSSAYSSRSSRSSIGGDDSRMEDEDDDIRSFGD